MANSQKMLAALAVLGATRKGLLIDKLAPTLALFKGAPCWEWSGFRDRDGYGKFSIAGHGQWNAHRVVFCLFGGEIPDGMVLDHRCRNRACCNPDHVRVVTPKENSLAAGSKNIGARNLAKTHCPQGHRYSPENTRPANRRGGRRCMECHRVKQRAYTARRKGA